MQDTCTPVSELGLAIRTQNVLLTAEVSSIEELHRMSDEELLSLPGFGWKTFDDVRSRLREHYRKAPNKWCPYKPWP